MDDAFLNDRPLIVDRRPSTWITLRPTGLACTQGSSSLPLIGMLPASSLANMPG